MYAHSAAVCQCSSRTPPAVSRMSTPAMVVETASSRTVTSRDHPPSCSRLWAKEKGYLKVCTPPASVGGGAPESRFDASRPGFVGPGSLALRSEAPFEDWPCANTFAALASALAPARAPVLTPRKPRRENFESL